MSQLGASDRPPERETALLAFTAWRTDPHESYRPRRIRTTSHFGIIASSLAFILSFQFV